MAIAPTGDIYKAFSFDNTSSRNFGVYITGSAVYNAPERDVEMVTVPGRNGNLVVDNGCFENIEVTYPAGIFAETEADFAQAISDLRNFLCSRRGYCRLSDEYNPDEYRLGIYKSGLEVEPSQLKAGEFELIFDCKPQRFLTSGEDYVSVASGGTITNPTLFDSQPRFRVKGYGNIVVNGETTKIEYAPYGKVLLSNGFTSEEDVAWFDQGNLELLNSGDKIYLYKNSKIGGEIHASLPGANDKITAVTAALGGAISGATVSAKITGSYQDIISIAVTLPTCRFDYGTFEILSDTLSGSITYKYNGTSYTRSYSADIVVEYDEYSQGKQYIRLDLDDLTVESTAFSENRAPNTYKSIYASSSKLIYDNYIHLDCELGEAYTYDNGIMTPVNNIVSFPSDLPVLKPGANEITYDNTITSFVVIPRWWKV